MPRCITQPDTHKLNMQRIVFPQSALLSEPRRRRSSASPLSGSAQERKAVRAASPSEHPKGMALTALRPVLHKKSLDGDNSICQLTDPSRPPNFIHCCCRPEKRGRSRQQASVPAGSRRMRSLARVSNRSQCSGSTILPLPYRLARVLIRPSNLARKR